MILLGKTNYLPITKNCFIFPMKVIMYIHLQYKVGANSEGKATEGKVNEGKLDYGTIGTLENRTLTFDIINSNPVEVSH